MQAVLKEKAKEIMSMSRCQMVKLLPYPALRSLKLVRLRRRLKSRRNGRGIREVVKMGGEEMEYTILVYKAEEGGF